MCLPAPTRADWPGAVVLLAVPVFFAGGVTATLAAIAGRAIARRAPAGSVRPRNDPADRLCGGLRGRQPLWWAGNDAGRRRVDVRPCCHGSAGRLTNVMTTNTRLASMPRYEHGCGCVASTSHLELCISARFCRRRLRSGLPLPLSLRAGAVMGAVAFGTAAPVVWVGGLTLWAARRSDA